MSTRIPTKCLDVEINSSNHAPMKAMNEKWELVANLARELGASEANLMKWKQRGFVPPKWHIPLITASKGKLKLADFIPSSGD